MKQHKRTESTHYDKLWVHTNQRLNDFRKNKMDTKARDHEYDKLDTFIQPQKSYTTRQQTEHINLEYENSTFVNKPDGKIVPSQTEVDIETVQLAEQVGNGEGLYDVTGQVSVEKVTAEEESNCDNDIGVQPITPDCELGDSELEICIEPDCHSFSETTDYEETEDEVTMSQKGGVGGGSEEYDFIARDYCIKKPMNNTEEIYDVVMNPQTTRKVKSAQAYDVCVLPPTSDGSLTTNEEDTAASSGYEEENGHCKQPTTQSPKPPQILVFANCL